MIYVAFNAEILINMSEKNICQHDPKSLWLWDVSRHFVSGDNVNMSSSCFNEEKRPVDWLIVYSWENISISFFTKGIISHSFSCCKPQTYQEISALETGRLKIWFWTYFYDVLGFLQSTRPNISMIDVFR